MIKRERYMERMRPFIGTDLVGAICAAVALIGGAATVLISKKKKAK